MNAEGCMAHAEGCCVLLLSSGVKCRYAIYDRSRVQHRLRANANPAAALWPSPVFVASLRIKRCLCISTFELHSRSRTLAFPLRCQHLASSHLISDSTHAPLGPRTRDLAVALGHSLHAVLGTKPFAGLG